MIMNIQDQANEYAKGRLAKIIERLIAEIYSDGFEAGYQTKSKEVDEIAIRKIAEAKAEVARAEAIKVAERAEAERIAREKAEAERAEAEKIAREKAEAEKAEAERIAREKAEQKRIAEEEAEAKRIAAEEAVKQKKAEQKKAENDKKDANIKNLKFIDLKLPSGTLWAIEYIENMTFREAKKRYHLPSIDQVNELRKECKLIAQSYDGFLVLNAEGKSFRIGNNGSDSFGSHIQIYYSEFWIDEEEDTNKNVNYARFQYEYNNGVSNGVSLYLPEKFVGETLPVLVVKSKQ